MKICLLAPSGYGKSTAIEILKKKYNIKNIKIADPLYELQEEFYKKIGRDCSDRQDGELLQFLGVKIRKENPTYLVDTFKEKLNNYQNEVNTIITNDDCRTMDYEHLKKLGFKFIKINGFKRDRNDLTLANPKLAIEWQSEIPFDYEVNNLSGLKEYEIELNKVMEEILNGK